MDGPGIAAVGIGIVFVYGGIKGYSPVKALGNIITGKNPNENQSTTGLTSAASTDTSTVNSGGLNSYNHTSLMALWIQVGGSNATANNAACHAMQESGGNPKVTSSNPDGGTNVGLWQLDTKGVGAGRSIAELQDPITNATITVQATGNGLNWGQWATPGC